MGDTAREAMGAAFDAMEAADEPEIQEEAAGPENEPDAEADGVAEPEPIAEPTGKTRDESGKFTKTPKAKEPIVTKKPALGTPSATAPGKTGVVTPTKAPTPGEASVALKAPISMKPEAREHWGSWPDTAKREFIRLNSDVQQALTKADQKSRGYEALQEAAAPYQAMIQASGADLPTVTKQLLSTAHELAYGPPMRKAQLLGHLIKSYGMGNEEGIKLLAAQLDGQPGQQQQQFQQQPQYRDPRVDQLLSQFEQAKTQRDTELNQAAASSIEQFSQGKEFYDDVKELMGELQETAGRKGRLLDLDKAYTLACQMHPDVSKVLSERQVRDAATATTAATRRSKVAASSIKGTPSMGSGASNGSRSRWEVLSEKYDEMMEQ